MSAEETAAKGPRYRQQLLDTLAEAERYTTEEVKALALRMAEARGELEEINTLQEVLVGSTRPAPAFTPPPPAPTPITSRSHPKFSERSYRETVGLLSKFGEREFTSADLRELAGHSRAMTNFLLAAMRERGEIKMTRGGPKTKSFYRHIVERPFELTRVNDTLTVRVGKAVEHIGMLHKTRGQLLGAVKIALHSKDVSISDGELARLVDEA